MYKVIGCSNCKAIFKTTAKLIARCPECAKQIPLYKQKKTPSVRVFLETQNAIIADEEIKKREIEFGLKK